MQLPTRNKFAKFQIPNEEFEKRSIEQADALALSVVPKDAEIIPQSDSPAESRIKSVNALLTKAYENASLMKITKEESKELRADFQDSDFQRGAGGDPNFLYLDYTALKNRLNDVLGLGQWAFMQTRTWSEDYRTAKGEIATRVYIEGALLIRGCYAGSAVGDMVYYKNNPKISYGDAYEGAKTSSFRRCTKDFGIGLQAYSRDWTDKWKAKYPGFSRP